MHTCLPPVTARTYRVQPIGAWPAHLGPPPDVHRPDQPAGEPGDLWRCQCGRLWQVQVRDLPAMVPGGQYRPFRWRRASLWTRLRYGGHPTEAPAVVKPGRPPVGPSGVSPKPDGSR